MAFVEKQIALSALSRTATHQYVEDFLRFVSVVFRNYTVMISASFFFIKASILAMKSSVSF
jgi:hypothetical protein